VTPRTPADVQSIFGSALEIESSVDRGGRRDGSGQASVPQALSGTGWSWRP
jgi:hypothetical protein